MRIFLLLLLTFLQFHFTPVSLATELTQDQERKLFSRASLYARQPHQLEYACKLFEQLTAARPDNLLYIRLHTQVLLQLGSYEEAAGLARAFQDRLPQTDANLGQRIEILALLSQISHRSGDGVQAAFFQQRARQLVGENSQLLLPLLHSLAQMKQEEQLLTIILEERRQRRNDDLWILEAGDSYLRQQKWQAAFDEYKRGFSAEEILESRLRQRILTIPLVDGLLNVALKWGERNSESLQITRTTAEWLVRQRQYTEAVPFYLRLDHLNNDDGKALLKLSELLVKEESWGLALTLLQEHEDLHQQHERNMERSLMITTCQRETNQPQAAIASLTALLRQTTDRNHLSRLQITMGDIYLIDMSDPAGALEWYNQVDGPGTWLATAYQKRVKTHLILDQFKTARDLNKQALDHFRFDQRISRQLRFQQVSLLYYSTDFAHCRTLLDSLAEHDFGSSIYNDILSKILLLDKAQDSADLEQLAHAELYLLQGKSETAAGMLLQLLQTSDNGEILLQASTLMTETTSLSSEAGIDNLSDLLSTVAIRLPDLIQLDEISYQRDLLIEREQVNPGVLTTGWEQFLLNYPRSPRADEVRARVRAMETENLEGDVNK
jgi:hypothetical protein